MNKRMRFNGGVSDIQVTYGSHGFQDPRGILDAGKVYGVRDVDIHDWHTRVYLDGFIGYFNSVWFNEV